MALVRLSCVLLVVMSLALSIQGASFTSAKNSSSIAQNVSEAVKPKNLSGDLVASASDNTDNLASVTGTSVTSTSGPLEQHQDVRPAVPPSTPAYIVPSYAELPAAAGPGYPGLGLGGFGGPGLGLGGFGGFPGFPGFGGNVGLDVSAGGYFPIVEKVIAVVGGGLFLLLVLACLQGSLQAGGLLHGLGQGFGILNPLNIQKGFSASASASLSKNVDLNNQVQQSINKKF